MSYTLVTILGRSRERRDTGYRTTTYRRPDGTRDGTAFFGLAPARRLRPVPAPAGGAVAVGEG